MSAEPQPVAMEPPASALHPPELSVALVTFENEADIGACLSSLKSNIGPLEVEVIVVDNASTDGTGRALDEWIGQGVGEGGFRMQRLRNSENLGYTRAMNQALRRAHGKKILLLNPDTRIEPGSLQVLAAYLDAHPDVGVVAPQLLNADGTVQPSCRRFPRRRDLLIELTGLPRLFPRSPRWGRWKMADFDHDEQRDVDQPQGACLMTRAEVLEGVGLLDERFPMFFSDVDWCRRVWQAGWRIVFVPEAKVVHRKGASVYRHRASMIWSSHRSFYDYWCKYASVRPRDRLLNMLLGAALWLAAVMRAAGSMVFRER